MTENVKCFIEENIDLLDDQNYLEVFKNSMDPNSGLNYSDVKEFLSVLESIGIIFEDNQLKQLFIEVMKNEIIQYFQYEPDESEKITWWLNHVPNNIFGYNEF